MLVALVVYVDYLCYFGVLGVVDAEMRVVK